MKKTKKPLRTRTLELNKETVLNLDHGALKEAVGGNNSTVASQCKTLCFT